jgi:hypothetical protein
MLRMQRMLRVQRMLRMQETAIRAMVATSPDNFAARRLAYVSGWR